MGPGYISDTQQGLTPFFLPTGTLALAPGRGGVLEKALPSDTESLPLRGGLGSTFGLGVAASFPWHFHLLLGV